MILIKKYFLLFILFVIFCAFFIYYQDKNFEREILQINQPVFIPFKFPSGDKIVLMFVGDIMMERGVGAVIERDGDGDFKFPFLKIKEILKEADILFGNLESIISDKGKKTGSIYSFRARPEAIEGLVFAGFNILSLANNHAFDYGKEALEDCMKKLKEAGIDYIGAGFSENEAYSPKIKEIKRTKFAFLAYTNLGSKDWAAKGEKTGIAWLEEEKLKSGIETAKKLADIIIVSFHFGDEYQKTPNPSQRYFAQMAIDYGANLVIGHHPHVVQPLEKYKDGWIAYSLGNFLFDQDFSKDTMQGVILKAIIEDGKIKEVIPIKTEIAKNFQIEIKND